jgi:glycine cleavage system regulatory protein
LAENLVITFVGPDRPGIVQKVSALIQKYQGNWLESKMARMAGRFAGIARVEVPLDMLEALSRDVKNLPDVSVIVESGSSESIDSRSLSYRLNTVGPDKRGILQEITDQLTRQGVNVVDLETQVSAAPMSGDKMFYADAQVLVPREVDLAQL